MNLPKHKQILILFTALMGLSNSTFAQRDYEEGYIVTNENDTIYGKVKDRKTGPFSEIHEKVRFKGKGMKKRFSASQIAAYKKGDFIFRTMFLNEEKRFLKLVSEGFVSHYILEAQEQGEQLVLDIDYFKKDDDQRLVRVTQGVFGLKKKVITAFFKDCPPMAAKIKNKAFKYPHQVVDFYNDWRQKNR